MTRKQMMNRLKELGFEDYEWKYYNIKDFLAYNRVPIKAITALEIQNRYFDDDTSLWTCKVSLVNSEGQDWGSLEV